MSFPESRREVINVASAGTNLAADSTSMSSVLRSFPVQACGCSTRDFETVTRIIQAPG